MNFTQFNKTSLSDGNRPAGIISGNRNFSSDEAASEINKYALWLKSLGVKKGSHAAVLCENNPDFIILLFALWQLNAVVVPLNVRLLDEEIERLVQHSESEFVFVHSNLSHRLNRKKFIFPEEVTIFPGEYQSKETDPESTAVILYTSGTTGESKGVILSFNNLYQSALSADTIIKHTHSDLWLCSLPFYHIGGLSIPVRAAVFGTKLIVPESLKAEGIKSSIERFRPTLVSFVSTTLKRLIELNCTAPEDLRIVLLGGGPIENELASDAISEGWNIVKVYGSTETSSLVTAVVLKERPDKLSTAGKPIGVNEVIIADENGQSLGVNWLGEVLISAKSVMKGYWKNPSETKLRLDGKYLSTSDLGFIDEDEFLHIEARRTDLIISGGENVNPLEVEEAILKYPGIREVCAFPLRDKEWGQIVAAAIVKENEEITPEDIKQFLRENISPYKIPREIFFTGPLPRTSLGKIKREALRNLFGEG